MWQLRKACRRFACDGILSEADIRRKARVHFADAETVEIGNILVQNCCELPLTDTLSDAFSC